MYEYCYVLYVEYVLLDTHRHEGRDFLVFIIYLLYHFHYYNNNNNIYFFSDVVYIPSTYARVSLNNNNYKSSFIPIK